MDFNHFFDFSHKWDYSKIHNTDKELLKLLQALQGEKFIYSVGNRKHAEMTLEALGIPLETFNGIFAYEDGDLLKAKPHKDSMDKFIDRYDINKKDIIFFDDTQSCIDQAIKNNWGRCILVNNGTPKDVNYEQTSSVKDFIQTFRDKKIKK
jgi:FMN phosphatase YigB (HAD superfamily)